MSAFSRGPLLRQVRLLPQFAPRTSCTTTPRRLFSVSAVCLLSKPKPKAKPKSKSAATTKVSSSARPSAPLAAIKAYTNTSYAATLAAKSHPTLLYEAPSHTSYFIAAYTSAAFCLTWAGVNTNLHVLHPPADLAVWVPYAFSGISFFMAAMGGWLLFGPMGLIRRITAFPVPGGGAAASAPRLEVELRKMFPLPGMPRRVITAAPADITLPHALAAGGRVETRLTRAEKEAARREAERKRIVEETWIMTRPFRHASQALFSGVKGLSRIWSREGFVKMTIKGQKYKLDVSGGWVLDQGRAIDRLVKIRD